MNPKKIIGKGLYKFIVAKGGLGVGGGGVTFGQCIQRVNLVG
jgi:hypothetical protein